MGGTSSSISDLVGSLGLGIRYQCDRSVALWSPLSLGTCAIARGEILLPSASNHTTPLVVPTTAILVPTQFTLIGSPAESGQRNIFGVGLSGKEKRMARSFFLSASVSNA